MRALISDGDAWLLALFVATGALPVLADVLHARALRAEATVGGGLAILALGALLGRARTHLRATALRRRLLARGPDA